MKTNRWRDPSEHDGNTRPFLGVAEGPRGNRYQVVAFFDKDGYFCMSSPAADSHLMASKLVAWMPLPRMPRRRILA